MTADRILGGPQRNGEDVNKDEFVLGSRGTIEIKEGRERYLVASR